MGHTEARRKRREEELAKKGDERLLEQRASFREHGNEIKKDEEKRGKNITVEEPRENRERDVTDEEKNDKSMKGFGGNFKKVFGEEV